MFGVQWAGEQAAANDSSLKTYTSEALSTTRQNREETGKKHPKKSGLWRDLFGLPACKLENKGSATLFGSLLSLLSCGLTRPLIAS